jgi:hypothetical protein
MALAADFNGQFLFGGTGRKGFAACAANRSFAKFGMDILFHASSLPYKHYHRLL